MTDLNPLATKAIKLRPKGTISEEHPERPASVRRAGNFLLKMLRIEYENKGSPIAGLSKEDALDALKDQLDRYVKGVHPFDRPLGQSKDVFKWWKRLDEDASLVDDDGLPEAQPLAVSG